MDARSERIAQRFEKPRLVAALLVRPVLYIEESPVGEPLDTLTAVLNWGIWLAFLVEAVGTISHPRRRRMARTRLEARRKANDQLRWAVGGFPAAELLLRACGGSAFRGVPDQESVVGARAVHRLNLRGDVPLPVAET